MALRVKDYSSWFAASNVWKILLSITCGLRIIPLDQTEFDTGTSASGRLKCEDDIRWCGEWRRES